MSESIRQQCAACRVSFTWWGTSKSLSEEHKNIAAQSIDMNPKAMTANKKLIDTKATAFKKLTSIKGEIKDYWYGRTLPYVEDGVRLLNREKVTSFNDRMEEYKQQLRTAAEEFEACFEEIKNDARSRLGVTYNEQDYPRNIAAMFNVSWDFPNTNPPDYLMEINPALYEQQKQRIEAQFNEAGRIAQQAFAEEMAKLVDHLNEKLQPNDDGSKKVFRDSAIGNFREFFGRFRELTSVITDQRDEALDTLVSQAEQLLSNVTPDRLRRNAVLQNDVRTGFQQIQDQLSQMVVNAPRRRLIRENRQPEAQEQQMVA